MPISSALGSSALLPAGLGFRNKIINGGFDIWQRGTSFSTSNAYTADRWVIVGASGQTVSVTQQAFTAGNAISGQEPQYYARLAWSGTPSGTFWFTQRVEDVRTCAGQTVVLSFWAKASSATSVFSPTIEQNFGSGGSSIVTTGGPAIALTTSWQRFVTIINVPSISGKTIGTNSYLDVRPLNGGSTVNGITIDIWGVQLEQNLQPTPFEQRPIGIELALCQRYYQRFLGGTNGLIYGYGYADSIGTAYNATFPLKGTMRATPTIGVIGTVTGFDVLTQRTITAFTSTRGSTEIASGDPSYSGGTFNANRNMFYFSGAGNNGVDFSAEL